MIFTPEVADRIAREYLAHPDGSKKPIAAQSHVDADSKRCHVCGETKLLTEFNRQSRNADGRRNDCRDCQKKIADAYGRRRREEKRFAKILELKAQLAELEGVK